MNKFPLTDMAVKMLYPNNVAQLDDRKLPSLLTYIPAFKTKDVLTNGDDSAHPGFIVNGVQIAGFYHSKFQNVIYEDRAYSLPAEDVATSVAFDDAYRACENKGYGWHLATAAEWAAIALWCKKNGVTPYGNNNYGKDVNEENVTAIATTHDVGGNVQKVASGTGALTWSHDGTLSGIWDMNGNVWELQGGIRLVWGEVQILANNDGADTDNPQNETSFCWKAINIADGTLVTPECLVSDTEAKTTGNTVKIDFLNDVWTYSNCVTNTMAEHRECKFAEMACASVIGNATKTLLQALALFPDDYDGTDAVCLNNGAAEQCIYRGGSWDTADNGGIFSILSGDRSESRDDAGFRASYVPNI